MIRVVTDDRERIARAIKEAGEAVGQMPPSPGARELTARLETFRREVESWETSVQPSPERIKELLDRVQEVRRLAVGTAPTLRQRKIE
jgi:transposase InsO family protein